MNQQHKLDFGAAVAIHEQLCRPTRQTPAIAWLVESLIDCQRWERRLCIAVQRAWHHAAQDSLDRLRGALEILRSRVDLTLEEIKTGDESTTHPHVQSDKLCEDEGTTVIRRALSEGRLFDFFCVVDRILRTYNPDSAYVGLSDWGGVTCSDCGDVVDSDDTRRCEHCQHQMCSDCSRCCCVCSDRYCDDCVSSCTACDDDCCHSCLQSCDDCGESFCTNCLTEGICDDCINHQKEEPSGREAEDEQSSATLHPVCLGEDPVLA